MRKVIAKVKLNPGQGGYFDPITRIHLTHADPEKEIYAGMNTEGLKTAIRNKRISLISGSLGDFTPPFKLVKQANGKIVLVMNNQKKVVQPAVNKKQVESKPSVKEEIPVNDKEIPVTIPDKQIVEITEPVTVEQPVVEEQPTVEEQLPVDIKAEDTTIDITDETVETQNIRYGKKNRKKHYKKEQEEQSEKQQ